MGVYVYKVTSHTVELSNGETANVAVYAYKPSYAIFGYGPSNDQMHFRSGASKCDKMAHTRSEWVVLGYLNKETGKVQVQIDGVAKRVGKMGSLTDGWFDCRETEKSAVAATTDRKVVLTRTKEVMTGPNEGVAIEYHYDRKVGWMEVKRSPFRTFGAAA